MPRKDYDEIKVKFAEFVNTWKTKNADYLNYLAVENVACRISSSPITNDSLDKLCGLKQFVSTYPKTDEFKIAIYSYACNLKENCAQQVAHVVCESLNYIEGCEELDCFYYCILCANHWVKTQVGWKMDEVHMDVYPFYWTDNKIFEFFSKTWYFANPLSVPEKDNRLPAITAEFDLPWEKYPECEDVLTEVEKIKECYAVLYFSADYSVNIHRMNRRSRHLNTNSIYHGEYDGIRNIVGGLRYKRLKYRYWAHPYRFENIKFNENHTWARCKVYRVFGWKQRNHEYIWTKSNLDIEHMCMGGFQEFVFEDGIWKFAHGVQKLGIYETGAYSASYYGDQI